MIRPVKALSFSSGELTPAFDEDTHEDTLVVSEDTAGVVVTPTASNKNFQVRTSIGSTEYKRTATVPVENGAVITIKCGDPSWPSMNGGAYGAADSIPAETYTVTVEVKSELDTTALAAAVVEAGAKVQEDYTEESYAALTSALTLPETTQDEVNTKVLAINQAIEGLVAESLMNLPFTVDFEVSEADYNNNIKDKWILIDADRDSENWIFYENAGISSYSWSDDNDEALDPDNYFISPVIYLPDGIDEIRVSWNIEAGDDEFPEDRYVVYVVGENDTSAENIILSNPIHEEVFNGTTGKNI